MRAPVSVLLARSCFCACGPTCRLLQHHRHVLLVPDDGSPAVEVLGVGMDERFPGFGWHATWTVEDAPPANASSALLARQHGSPGNDASLSSRCVGPQTARGTPPLPHYCAAGARCVHLLVVRVGAWLAVGAPCKPHAPAVLLGRVFAPAGGWLPGWAARGRCAGWAARPCGRHGPGLRTPVQVRAAGAWWSTRRSFVSVPTACWRTVSC
jgi:hypothetical protein